MDTVKGLKEIIRSHPDVLKDSQRLRAILRDFFPEDKRTQNTLIMVVDEGILDDIYERKEINKFQMFGYIKSLSSDYGVSEMIAKKAILTWAEALEITAEDVPVIDDSMVKSPRLKTDATTVDYSDITSEQAEIKGKILKFTGNGGKVFPGIVIPKGTYIVQETGGVCAKYYDKSNQFTFIMNELNNPKHEKMFQTPSHMEFGEPGILEVNSSKDWVLVLKPIG